MKFSAEYVLPWRTPALSECSCLGMSVVALELMSVV